MTVQNRLELRGAMDSGFERVLTPEALEFLAELEQRFGPRRRELLEARVARRARLRAGEMLDFLPETRAIREADWQVAPAPPDMRQRWVEITGPIDRKMVINALNSGADGVHGGLRGRERADLAQHDHGHINLRDAIERSDHLRGIRTGSHYELGERSRRCLSAHAAGTFPSATCWSTASRSPPRCSTSGCTSSTALGAAGANGTGPYLYLPKMESHLEARLWNDVFCFAQDAARDRPRHDPATVLIETLPAAFEMDEIL